MPKFSSYWFEPSDFWLLRCWFYWRRGATVT